MRYGFITEFAVKRFAFFVRIRDAGIEVYLPLAGLIDVEKENARLNKELAAIDKELSRVEGKLGNAGFLAKAPEAVIEKEKARAEELNGNKAAINERLEYLKTL
mgnify:CR=1 FL=1